MYGRWISSLASVCLHLGVLVLVLFWPAPEPPELSPSSTMISGLVSFNPIEGKAAQPTKQEQPESPQRPVETAEAQPKPVDTKPDKPEVTPRDVQETQPKVEPTTTKPPVETSEATPVPKDPEKPKEDQPKPVPQKNATEKPPKKEDLDSALADISKNTKPDKPKPQTKPKSSGDDLASALADLGKEVGGSGDGSQGSGSGSQGGTGYGIAGAYMDSVVSRVRPQWSWPGRVDRRNYVAVVNVKIAADGTITSYSLVTPSGNDFFDSTVLRAVQATRVLEPPPDTRFMDLDISFSPESLSRR